MTLKREIDELKKQGGGARAPPSPPSPSPSSPSPEVRRREAPEFIATFEGHANYALQMYKQAALNSGSYDRAIRAWSLDANECIAAWSNECQNNYV